MTINERRDDDVIMVFNTIIQGTIKNNNKKLISNVPLFICIFKNGAMVAYI